MVANQTRWGERSREPVVEDGHHRFDGRPLTYQSEILLRVRDYDLAATLDSGQVFRWRQQNDSWIGVIGKHRVRLTQTPDGIHADHCRAGGELALAPASFFRRKLI